MGHYDGPDTVTVPCEDCGDDVTTYPTSPSPTLCTDCTERRRDPSHLTTELSIEVKPQRGEIWAEVTITNDNTVPVTIETEEPDDADDPIAVVGYLRLQADGGDSIVAEVPYLQDGHAMDAGRLRMSPGRSRQMRFVWDESGIRQESPPTMKYEGEIGTEFRDRTMIHTGDPFDGDSVTAMFAPTESPYLDTATDTEDIPSWLIDL